MKITFIKIYNYRNLDGLEVNFNKDINFIVGENNIGKSNFQDCIFRVLSGKSFLKEDFSDDTKKIKIEMTFCLNTDEIGIFDDLVDPKDRSAININAIQDDCEEYIKFYHKESNELIPNNIIKKINVIAYDSLRNPKNEIDFSKTKGAGAFLNYLIEKYVKSYSEKGVINQSEISKVRDYVSSSLKKLTAFNRFGIKPEVDVDEGVILSKILVLKDENNIDVPNNGYGVQFNILIMLSLLEKIIKFDKKSKGSDTEFSTLLLFDEPEIHMHPYLQRTIIKDIMQIASGKDECFNELLEEHFGIKKVSAQIIITTHSPNMLNNDYKKIIRMYKKNNNTLAVSCADLKLKNNEQKQLLMQFEYIKESVFAKTAIVVEGDSEFGSFRLFGEKCDVDFDRCGISLIKAGGADSVIPIIKLFNQLGIKAVGVIDNDKRIEKKLPDEEYLFYTSSKCFDSEIVKKIISKENFYILEEILQSYDGRGKDRCIQKEKLNEIINKFNYKNLEADNSYRFKDIDTKNPLYEIMYVSWFAINKGVLLGKVIGSMLNIENIPDCYVNAINKVKEFAEESGR